MTFLPSSFTNTSTYDSPSGFHRSKFHNIFHVRSSLSKLSNSSSIFDENIHAPEESLDTESIDSIEKYELYHKFKTVDEAARPMVSGGSDSTQLVEDTNFKIDFDNDSLDFSVCLNGFDTSPSENESPILMELSPFESASLRSLRNSRSFSKYRDMLHKIKSLLNKSASVELLSPDKSGEPYSPISMKVPINENNSASGFNKKLDLSLFEEFADDEQDPDNQLSTIKFNDYADILIYNNNYYNNSIFNFDSPFTESPPVETQTTNTLSRKLSFNKLKRNLSISRKASQKSMNKATRVNSILKSKINKNFNTEITNAKNTDSVEFEIFLKNFEDFEMEKFRNEPGLNNLRLLQLKNYYERQFSHQL